MASLSDEISSRRTFAIISHPDAGKTTLTEKLLLYTGSIQTAGSVKGKSSAKHAVSDWMDIEKERGISVTSSVMQFQHDGFCINIVPTFECVEMYYTHNGLPWDRDPETMHIDPYAYNAEKETVNLHVYKEPRFYASVGYDRGTPDGRRWPRGRGSRRP